MRLENRSTDMMSVPYVHSTARRLARAVLVVLLLGFLLVRYVIHQYVRKGLRRDQ